jgi:hypothetical protein
MNYTTIQDLKGSNLIQWDGRNNAFYQTSNRLLKAWHVSNKNALLNSVTVKQASKYDRRLFNDMLTKGVAFNYQYQVIELKQSKRYIKVTITNTKTNTTTQVNLTQASAKRLISQYDLNKDVGDVFNAILDKIG